MLSWLETHYTNLVSGQFRNFNWKNSAKTIAEFSCPFCGDSKKDKTKARGYLLLGGKSPRFYCHNCFVSVSFFDFLKNSNELLYKEYCLEKLKDNNNNVNYKKIQDEVVRFDIPVFKQNDLRFFVPVSELEDDNHFCLQYVQKRRIPRYLYDELYFSSNFKKDLEQHEFFKRNLENNENRRKENYPSDSRLIIPFYNEKNDLTMLQGRALNASKIRYTTYKVDEDELKVYGLNRVNKKKPVYVLEGPIDSMFVENSIALAGSNINIKELQEIFPTTELIFVYDNEPYNESIIKIMKNMIERGYSVVIWDYESNKEKDINNMVLHNIDYKSTLRNRVFRGIEAKMELNFWKRI